MFLPEPVRFCLDTLNNAGFRDYAVGGCVRDSLLDITPHDYDLCTNAVPEDICQVFRDFRLVRSGEKHGTIGVVMDKEVIEITTFRTEGGYQDNRHPGWVRFVDDLTEDLARRDFTINAMAYSPQEGYVDPFGGQEDLNTRRLRCVGDPATRFTEDALRILRGVRFAVRFSLSVEAETEKAMIALSPLMEKLARERVFDELCKLLPLVTAQDLLRFAPVLTQVIPELSPSVGFQQHTHHHIYDVFTHTAHVVEAAPKELPLRWAALLHDIGKPACFTMDENGRGHFLGHAKRSAAMADEVLRRLKAPTVLREQVLFLIEQHMTPLVPDKHILRRRLSRHGEEQVRMLLALQRADFGSKGTGTPQEEAVFGQIERLLDEIIAEADCLTIRSLAIDGHDLMALGFAPGPQLGQCLSALLSQVLEDRLPNEKAALLVAAKEFLKS